MSSSSLLGLFCFSWNYIRIVVKLSHKRGCFMRKTYKIETYLPFEALDNIRDALYKLGLGKVGNYEDCMSWYEINSSWKPVDGANPYLGTVGEVEFAPEYKLEFRCEEDRLRLAVDIVKKNHPYEEVGINIFELIEL